MRLCIYVLVTAVIVAACNESNKPSSATIFQQYIIDTLKEAYKETDIADNDYLAVVLKPIRENFKKINSCIEWKKVVSKNINETTEGGEVRYYYSQNSIEKIIVHRYAETGQQLGEYYLLDGRLSFVLEKTVKYNRPAYWDSVISKQNNDSSVFEMEQSEVIEDRSYFINGRLRHQINNQDCGAPNAPEFLKEEEKRIISEFNKMLSYLNP